MSSSRAATEERAASASVVRRMFRGGDGGDGGSIFLEADPAITTLLDFHYQRHYTAERGQHGKGSNKHGASGEDTILRVPLGTVVSDGDTGERLGDLTQPG